ncbi:Homoprotocatechuate catabolism bifunctional isomerase/decarboxylase [Arthrobacter sp. SO5]|uniref:fumarylacetoacetate hydrolase family protein n=1 Tax=Arthrobacter sp. SO5 TaxID=1897055 RepID=UPI001E370DC9|nr:fumarylacetoacetate hydrolase family protein [Arthrobacter sp. SO5]MCB5273320.1 Homoprotocatechuate catabolism bifunctional isomerase/decarboxylase [Arthrobacter sp. SO5]
MVLSENISNQHAGLPAVDAATLRRVRKVLAVHLSYPSRAAQRGRVPQEPSYFMKATSSLSVTGSTVERPAGTELLAFEGEIALIIGRTARRVGVEEAWSHVGAVTAANDLGVYDLKYADKGSNVRSKSGDGFTPLGTYLVPADRVDPTALRIRTWVNGELVQQDTTQSLLFPFAQIVADLSQLMTLEPGDVILTGTPAGSSVVVPGDVMEVEVDTPAHDGGTALSSGRLTTTVVQGESAFADFGSTPRITDQDRVEAFGSAAAAGLTPEAPVLTPELKAKLGSVATATLSSQLRRRGLNNVSIDGLQSTRPERRVVGLARTLRYVPNREDLFTSHGGGFNAQKRAIDSVNEGDILVMEARGEKGTGTIGDILALRAQVRGAAAVITDGGVRDFTAVAGLDMVTYFANPHPAVLGRRHVPWDTDITIACGGATVQPGDIIVADADGILVIPPALAEELADDCIRQEQEEAFIFEMVKEGNSVDGLYPMNAQWQEKYAQWRAASGRER